MDDKQRTLPVDLEITEPVDWESQPFKPIVVVGDMDIFFLSLVRVQVISAFGNNQLYRFLRSTGSQRFPDGRSRIPVWA